MHKNTSVTLEPLNARHAHELILAARAVAADTSSAVRLWWAKPDYAIEDAEAFIGASINERQARHGESFVVRDEAGAFIGCVSAKNIDRMHGCFQGGYWIIPGMRGRGYGQAAMRALHAWSLSIGLVRMELLIGVDNVVCLAVADKLGFIKEGRLNSRFQLHDKRIDVYMMALNASA